MVLSLGDYCNMYVILMLSLYITDTDERLDGKLSKLLLQSTNMIKFPQSMQHD